MNSIALIGCRGTGKTTFGRYLAQKLGVRFADTDVLIEEKYGESIAGIFARGGESLFRRYETETLRELESVPEPLVIAAGGGLPLREENRIILRRLAGLIILLTASPDAIAERLTRDPRTASTRPPLTNLSFRDEIGAVLKERTPLYRSLADITLDSESLIFPR